MKKLICCIALFMFSNSLAFAEPLVPGPNTVILDHFDGSTVGNAVGSVSYVQSQSGLGKAVQFGSGGFIQYTIGALSQGTIEMRLKPTIISGDGSWSLLDLNWNNTYTNPPAGHILGIGIYGLGSSNMSFSTSSWDWSNSWNLQSPIQPINNWTYFAVSWGPGGAKEYMNGILLNSTSNSGIAFLSTNYIYLNYFGNSSSTGLIDEFQLSNIQLSDAVIAQHAGQSPDANVECLFNWAEKNYSTLFDPSGETSVVTSTDIYRTYSKTNSSLRVSLSNDHVYYQGIDGKYQDVGPLSDWLLKANCPIPPEKIACLFVWAEDNYPSLLAPKGATTQLSSPYSYRYYKDTNSYVGVSSTDNHVYYLESNGVLQNVGDLSGLLIISKCR